MVVSEIGLHQLELESSIFPRSIDHLYIISGLTAAYSALYVQVQWVVCGHEQTDCAHHFLGPDKGCLADMMWDDVLSTH